MRKLCRFPFPPIRKGCAIRSAAIFPIPMQKHTASFGRICIGLRCSPVKLRESAHGIVLRLRQKLFDLPISHAISCSWSQWDCRQKNITCKACPPLCRKMYSLRFCAPFPVWSMWKLCGLLMPLSMTVSIRRSCVQRWNAKPFRGSMEPGSLTAVPVMRKPVHRDWLRESMLH